MSEDPIGFDGRDANLYAYVGNGPVTCGDSVGLTGPVTFMFPESAWFAEHDPKYNHPWFKHLYTSYHFGVADDEEIFEILGLDPDTVRVTLDTVEVYGNRVPYILLMGDTNEGTAVTFFGLIEQNNHGPVVGYTFYTSMSDLTWNLTGSDKLKALSALAPYYGLGSTASFARLSGRPVSLRPRRVSKGLPAAGSHWTGRIGELFAGTIQPKTPIYINGRTRIPDGLTAKVLTEVKNVARLSFTRQLRDFADYASNNGLVFVLYVRPTTILSATLLDAINAGRIVIKYLPGG